MKPSRPSVMRTSEWWKREKRDPDEWRNVRAQVLERDNYSCVYCGVRARKFMQVNHVGAEDSHDVSNLETVCKPCHQVLHMGINSSEGNVSVITTHVEQADIVRLTRRLVWAGEPWEKIEREIIARVLVADGKVYDRVASVEIANEMLQSIPPGAFRGVLPDGLAVVFHEQGEWNGFPEQVHRWSMGSKQSEEYMELVRRFDVKQ